MSDFVVIEKDQFETYLPDGFQTIETKAKEYVYQGETEKPNVGIRVYSSVDIKTNKTRDIGSDAIRVVLWDLLNDRPLGKGKRIHRVEGATTIKDRIQQRIKHFMADSHNLEVIDYEYVRAILNSDAVNWMGFAQSLLEEGLEKYGSLTEGQLAYVLGEKNPKGKMTFEARAKLKDPNFLQKYIDSLEEDQDEESEIEAFERATKIDETEEEEIVEKIERGSTENVDLKNLIKTKTYKKYQYPFKYFNPVQSAVIPHIKEDKNMIISSSTSSGKTICAELIMDYVLEHGI